MASVFYDSRRERLWIAASPFSRPLLRFRKPAGDYTENSQCTWRGRPIRFRRSKHVTQMQFTKRVISRLLERESRSFARSERPFVTTPRQRCPSWTATTNIRAANSRRTREIPVNRLFAVLSGDHQQVLRFPGKRGSLRDTGGFDCGGAHHKRTRVQTRWQWFPCAIARPRIAAHARRQPFKVAAAHWQRSREAEMQIISAAISRGTRRALSQDNYLVT